MSQYPEPDDCLRTRILRESDNYGRPIPAVERHEMWTAIGAALDRIAAKHHLVRGEPVVIILPPDAKDMA